VTCLCYCMLFSAALVCCTTQWLPDSLPLLMIMCGFWRTCPTIHFIFRASLLSCRVNALTSHYLPWLIVALVAGPLQQQQQQRWTISWLISEIRVRLLLLTLRPVIFLFSCSSYKSYCLYHPALRVTSALQQQQQQLIAACSGTGTMMWGSKDYVWRMGRYVLI
jgi:hypothetical protein